MVSMRARASMLRAVGLVAGESIDLARATTVAARPLAATSGAVSAMMARSFLMAFSTSPAITFVVGGMLLSPLSSAGGRSVLVAVLWASVLAAVVVVMA